MTMATLTSVVRGVVNQEAATAAETANPQPECKSQNAEPELDPRDEDYWYKKLNPHLYRNGEWIGGGTHTVGQQEGDPDPAPSVAKDAASGRDDNRVEQDEYDGEEVFEFEHSPGLPGRPGVSPLDSGTAGDPSQKALEVANRRPRCQHIKPSGLRCGSPAMRRIDYCYYHKRTHIGPRLLYPTLMMLEDAHGIQAALMEVLCAMLEGGLTEKQAALMLYALQTAASNLKRVQDLDPDQVATEEPEHDRPQDGIFEPEKGSKWKIEHEEVATS